MAKAQTGLIKANCWPNFVCGIKDFNEKELWLPVNPMSRHSTAVNQLDLISMAVLSNVYSQTSP